MCMWVIWNESWHSVSWSCALLHIISAVCLLYANQIDLMNHDGSIETNWGLVKYYSIKCLSFGIGCLQVLVPSEMKWWFCACLGRFIDTYLPLLQRRGSCFRIKSKFEWMCLRRCAGCGVYTSKLPFCLFTITSNYDRFCRFKWLTVCRYS